jgi:flagellar biosynthesis GTPase FlhF
MNETLFAFAIPDESKQLYSNGKILSADSIDTKRLQLCNQGMNPKLARERACGFNQFRCQHGGVLTFVSSSSRNAAHYRHVYVNSLGQTTSNRTNPDGSINTSDGCSGGCSNEHLHAQSLLRRYLAHLELKHWLTCGQHSTTMKVNNQRCSPHCPLPKCELKGLIEHKYTLPDKTLGRLDVGVVAVCNPRRPKLLMALEVFQSNRTQVKKRKGLQTFEIKCQHIIDQLSQSSGTPSLTQFTLFCEVLDDTKPCGLCESNKQREKLEKQRQQEQERQRESVKEQKQEQTRIAASSKQERIEMELLQAKQRNAQLELVMAKHKRDCQQYIRENKKRRLLTDLQRSTQLAEQALQREQDDARSNEVINKEIAHLKVCGVHLLPKCDRPMGIVTHRNFISGRVNRVIHKL